MALLRHSGGKAQLSQFIEPHILVPNKTGVFAEPFAGGASVALRVAGKYPAIRIFLNDADPDIAAFWRCVVTADNRSLQALLRQVKSCVPSLEKYKSVLNSQPKTLAGRAFKTLFLNRTSFITSNRTRPLGGWGQRDSLAIQKRWNSAALARQIAEANDLLCGRAEVFNEDFADFLKRVDNSWSIYLDPPYYEVGNALYKSFWLDTDHVRLRDIVRKLRVPWALSYHSHPRIHELYSEIAKTKLLPARYFSSRSRKVSEPLFLPAQKICANLRPIAAKTIQFNEEPTMKNVAVSQSGFTAKWEWIPPATAMEMLKAAGPNRHKNRAKIARLDSDMVYGRYQTNGETIIFDKHGRLIDGQHRLEACVQSGKPFEALVVRGVDPSAISTIDQGQSRSLADAIMVGNPRKWGKGRSAVHAAAALNLINGYAGIYTKQMSRMEVRDEVNRDPALATAVTWYMDTFNSRQKQDATKPASTIGALYIASLRGKEAAAKKYLQQLGEINIGAKGTLLNRVFTKVRSLDFRVDTSRLYSLRVLLHGLEIFIESSNCEVPRLATPDKYMFPEVTAELIRKKLGMNKPALARAAAASGGQGPRGAEAPPSAFIADL